MGTDDYRMAASYQFGHTELASRRLAEVARVFRPSTEAFLREAPVTDARRVLDLGCGPGHTTRLLAERFPSASVTGVDLSAEFLVEAARDGGASIEYQRLDVTAGALPPADLAYCRFLLSHVADPPDAIARWGAQLAPAGLLLIDEVEAIHPNLPAFETYLGLVEAMIADQGAQLYIGPAIAASPDPSGLERCFDRVCKLPVSRSDAALMFSMNVPNWKDKPFIRAHCPPEEIAALETDLQRLARTDGGEPVLWELRQIAWRLLVS